jgi:Flp pilus assembly pilin Flp
MTNFIKAFARDENGAVTVDWVVLTAAVVGLAVAAYGSIQTGSANLTAATDTTLSNMTVGNVSLPAAE